MSKVESGSHQRMSSLSVVQLQAKGNHGLKWQEEEEETKLQHVKEDEEDDTVENSVVAESPNRCVECGDDLGDSNPRQLCGKTRCYNMQYCIVCGEPTGVFPARSICNEAKCQDAIDRSKRL